MLFSTYFRTNFPKSIFKVKTDFGNALWKWTLENKFEYIVENIYHLVIFQEHFWVFLHKVKQQWFNILIYVIFGKRYCLYGAQNEFLIFYNNA